MSKAVTYWPFTRSFYQGDVHKADLEHGDFHLDLIGKLNPDRKLGDGRFEFQAEVMRRAERQAFQGLSETGDLDAITTSELLGEVILKEHRDFYAILGATTVPVSKLEGKVPIAGKYRASEKVPEGVEIGQKKSTYTKVDYKLWKNGAVLEATMEAQMRGTFSPLNFDIDIAAGELGRSKNKQVAAAIETFTTAGKASWSAQSGGVSTNNPLTHITTEVDTLIGLDARPSVVAVRGTVAGAFATNTWINTANSQGIDQYLGGKYPVPKYPGMFFIVDNAFTSTMATVYDPKGILLLQGPVVAKQFDNPKSLVDGYVIAEFMQALKTSNNLGRTMTSVN